jgi:hypothetical protein
LGFIKPSASPTVDEPQVSFLGDGGNDLLDILSAPKLPDDELAPLDTKIEPVHYQPCDIKNLRLTNPDKQYANYDDVSFSFEAECTDKPY